MLSARVGLAVRPDIPRICVLIKPNAQAPAAPTEDKYAGLPQWKKDLLKRKEETSAPAPVNEATGTASKIMLWLYVCMHFFR